MADDLIIPLSKFTANLEFADLPDEIVKVCQIFLLDSLGVAAAGSSAPGVENVLGQVRRWGGEPESHVLIHGDRLPAPWAALINGMMIQARDFDDTHHEAIVHVHSGVLPTVLALSQVLAPVNGKRFITALVAGIDVACRIGKAVTTPVAFTRTGTLAYFGATAAASQLLGLDPETTRHAFGIAYSQTAGNMQAVHDGGLVKRMHPGFGAMGGVMSALWAKRGLTGSQRVLEGPYGYLNLYERGDYIRERVIHGLGQQFEISSLSIKPYPCSLDTHAAIMGSLALREEYELRPEMIDHITIDMPFLAYDAAGQEFDHKVGNPVVDAILSASYTVAVALIYGKVNLDHFTEEAVRSPEVVALARKIEPRLDKTLPEKAFVPVKICISLKDGRILSRKVETLLGTPAEPLDRTALLEKFWHCTSYAAKPLSGSKLREAISLIDQLPELEDANILINKFVA